MTRRLKSYRGHGPVNPSIAAICGLLAASAATAALGAAALLADSNRHPPTSHRLHKVFGHSVDGRRLIAVRLGNPDAKRTALVVGQIHGDEPAGQKVIQALRLLERPFRDVAIWTVLSVNPDGNRLNTRKNARGVDLNRNFSYRWSGAEPPSSGYYGGPHPFSEPESRAVRRLVRRIDPNVSIWFHQPWDAVLACGRNHALESTFARIAHIRTECRGGHLPGTAIEWENHRCSVRGSAPKAAGKGAEGARKSRRPCGHAFVVEFHGGSPSAGEVRRAARATAHVAAKGAR